jgi:hypothetical protein
VYPGPCILEQWIMRMNAGVLYFFSEFDRSSERHSLHNNTSSRGLTHVSGDKTKSFSHVSFAVY